MGSVLNKGDEVGTNSGKRIVVARGRDAADVPLVNSFGPHVLKDFRVWTDEVTVP